MNYYYILIALFSGYVAYKLFTFVKRKIRWAIATIPMLTMVGGTHLPQSKLQHFLSLFS